MLRNSRIDKPAQHKPWGRCLTLQRLEERLALSAASPTTPSTLNFDLSVEGGFVDVSVLQQGINFFNSDAEPTISFGGLGSFDVTVEQPLFDIVDVLSNDFDLSIIPPPDPFPSDPGGGVVGPLVESRPFGPLPTEELLPPAGSEESVAAEFSIVEETPQRQAHEITLSRGREVFFKVAALAPPQNLSRPDRIALSASAAHHEPLQTESAPAARGEQSYGPVTESPTKATAAEQPATEKVGSVLQSQETGRAASSTTVHYKPSANQTIPASRPKAAATIPEMPSTALQSVAVAMSEEETRSRVFADWRNHDLIALPLLVALAAGPRLLRSLRSPTTEAQQLPPKRNLQTVTL